MRQRPVETRNRVRRVAPHIFRQSRKIRVCIPPAATSRESFRIGELLPLARQLASTRPYSQAVKSRAGQYRFQRRVRSACLAWVKYISQMKTARKRRSVCASTQPFCAIVKPSSNTYLKWMGWARSRFRSRCRSRPTGTAFSRRARAPARAVVSFSFHTTISS